MESRPTQGHLLFVEGATQAVGERRQDVVDGKAWLVDDEQGGWLAGVENDVLLGARGQRWAHGHKPSKAGT